PVDDLDGVVVVPATVAEVRLVAGVSLVLAARSVTAGELEVEARKQALALDLAGGDLRGEYALVGQLLARQLDDGVGCDASGVQLVAQHVVGAHLGADRRRDVPTLVWTLRTVERTPAEHVPDSGVRAAHRVAVRVIVVVPDTEVVAELVCVDRATAALRLDRGL